MSAIDEETEELKEETKKDKKKAKKVKKEPNKFWLGVKPAGFLLIGLLLFTSCKWSVESFGHVTFATMFYQMTLPIGGSNPEFSNDFMFHAFWPPVIVVIAVYLFITIWGRKFLKYKHYMIIYIGEIALIFAGILYANAKLDVFRSIGEALTPRTIYQDNYVDPEEVDITFPKDGEKKNLILIYLESMEISLADEENGGKSKDNLIPNLTDYAGENISFSDKAEGLGGFYSIPGTAFTYGAMMSSSTGIPYGMPNWHDIVMTKDSKTMERVTAIGDILADEGYNQMFMCGSQAKFSGRDAFYKTHGNYEICDYNQAKVDGLIPEDYMVFWGFEDEYLFKYAKDKITELSKEDKPFNFTMLTVDTHNPEGYVCDKCENEYDEQYSNVIKCSDKQVKEFVEWIKAQDFYKDTVVVLVGDHISMAGKYYDTVGIEYEDRRVYNCFINCEDALKDEDALQNRTFTTIDLYPTILASLGADIEGDRLGLGTNLFSGKETLPEKMGLEEFEKQLNAWSFHYFNSFVKSK